MSFQRNVFLATGGGIPGQIFADSPHKVESFQLESALAAYNVMGETCFTISSQGVAQAGNPSGTATFAGFLIDPLIQSLAVHGTGQSLSPSLVLQNGTQAELLTQGTIIVSLPNTANIGDFVIYNNTTGALASIAPTTSLPSGFSYAGAVVDYFTTVVNGLAVITVSPMSSYAFNSLVVSNLTVGTLTANNFIQPYAQNNALLTSMTGKQVWIFGDSIAAGSGAVPTTNRWSTQLCGLLGSTEHNFAVSGQSWPQCAQNQLYNNYTGSGPVIFAFGTNDIRTGNLYDQTRRCVESAVLFACLYDTKVQVATSNVVGRTGTWTPWGNFGLQSNVLSSSLEIPLHGRFLIASVSIPQGATITSNVPINILVDGTPISSEGNVPLVTYLNQGNCSSLLFIDTQSAPNTAHTLEIIVGTPVGGSSVSVYVEWFASFDLNQPGTPVFLNAIYDLDLPSNSITTSCQVSSGTLSGTATTDFIVITDPNIQVNSVVTPVLNTFGSQANFIGCTQGVAGSATAIYSGAVGAFTMSYTISTPSVTIAEIDSLNQVYLDVARRFGRTYGLPIYFMRNTGKFGTIGELRYDLLHPNNYGHTTVANNIFEFMKTGELFYFDS